MESLAISWKTDKFNQLQYSVVGTRQNVPFDMELKDPA